VRSKTARRTDEAAEGKSSEWAQMRELFQSGEAFLRVRVKVSMLI
jgi:hypothetical protein